jgi:GMP synthase (glutamine-hydrolysing)
MRSVIAIRHVPFEDLDAFGSALAAYGYTVSFREAPVDDLSGTDLATCDLLVILGGPIGANEDDHYRFLKDEIVLIEHRLKFNRPVLGICLGAQLMARALGAKVYPSGVKEIGWAPLSLTKAGRDSCLGRVKPGMRVLHWHGDTFDLPTNATRLASTSRTLNQAFAVNNHGLALQFHLEATAKGLERWYVGHAVEIAATPRLTVTKLRMDAARYAGRLEPHAQACFETWLDGLPQTGRGDEKVRQTVSTHVKVLKKKSAT